MSKVLIVDDQSDNRYLLDALVRGFGYEAIHAENGVEALEVARRDPPDIVISDILMPTMDGFTLCREWMKDERLRRVPFVFYTATYTGDNDKDLAMMLGAARFIVKPTDPEDFIGIVRQVLRDREVGLVIPPPERAEGETVTHRLYSEVLVRKLEKKTLDLENTRRSLEAEQSRLREFFDNLPIMAYKITLDGKIINCNPVAVKTLGYEKKEDLLGKTLVDEIYAPSSRPKAERLFETWKAEGKLKNEEIQVVTRQGEIMDVLLNADTIHDRNGNPLHSISTHVDITDRKRAREALRESKEKLDQIMNSTAEGICGLDMAGNCTFCNPAALGILGYRNESDLLGKDMHALAHHTRVDGSAYLKDECTVVKAIGKGEYFHSDNEYLWRADGKSFPAEFWCHPIVKDRDMVGAVYTFVDITERKNLENQFRHAQKMEAVGRLAGGVAHDFNNMLGVIIGHAEMGLMRLNPLDPLFKDLQEIKQAADRSSDMTRQLLAFSRKQVVNPQVTDPNKVIADQQKMLGRLIGEDIALKFLPGEDLWKIRIDVSQVVQILANLAVNSRDAIKGQGAITISTANVALDESYCHPAMRVSPGDYVMVSCSDTGSGMDTATRERIFEPFFTTKEEGKGTGLGLSTVYGIVQQHGGTIHVYSEPGMGTTFRIYFPRFRGEAEEPAEIPEEKSLEGKETVLIVEDEQQILNLARRILGQHGYKVMTARTPGEACLLVERHQGGIHLLITDVIMPAMNGKELQARLEKIRPGFKTLFMSGYAADALSRRGVIDEGIDFIPKPFTVKSLAEKVRAVLDA